jgi:hypothetical protein
MNSEILIIAALLSLIIILPTISNDDLIYAHAACNDGSTSNDAFQEDVLCPRDFSKKPAYLNYNITTSGGHTTTKLSLHENGTGDIVKYVLFYIAINNTEKTKQQPSFHDFFQIESGTLVLDYVHNTSVSNNSLTKIENAHRDPFYNAWVPTYGSNKITITNFPLAANKTYDMHVVVFGTDDPRSFTTPEQAPKVDFIFSTSKNPDSEGKVLIVPEVSSLLALSAITAGSIGILVMTGRMIKFRER